MIVVKVGGSLYDLPDLGPRLRRFLDGLDDPDRLVVPGGGAAADVVRGRKVSAYPACGPEITTAGGEFVSVPFEAAVTDGNLVTGPAWTAHVEWLKQFLALLR